MADEADHASDYIDRMVADALSSRLKGPQNAKGSKICLECGENIPDPRRKLGFKLCIECAEETERRESLFAK